MLQKSLAATLGVAIAIAVGGCSEPASLEETVRPVRAVKVGDLKAIDGREFPGRAAAKDEVDLSFQVSGPLVALNVDVGSEVTKGDVIAAIDPRDFQAALDSAESNLARAKANLLAMERGARPEEIEQLKAAVEEAEATYRQARTEYERNEPLVESGVISQAEFDLDVARLERTTAQLKRAREDLNIGTAGARPEDLDAKRSEIGALQAAVVAAQNQLDYSVLKAPFDGTVASRYVDNYQTVQAKQPIVRLLDVSQIEVTIQVPENLISLAPLVKNVVCRFDAFADREFEGQVTKTGSEASQTTRTYPVTIEIDQPEDATILPGMAANVRVQPDETGAEGQDLVVPSAAVFSDDGEQSYVWVVEEQSQTAARRAITTGKLTPVGLAVREGLASGEWVVTAGVNSLRENQKVKILQEGN